MSKHIAEDLIEALYASASVPPGCRINHARGVLVEGRFRATREAAQFCAAPIFGDAEQHLIARFSDSGPNPHVAQDSAAASPRGLAVKIGRPSALVLVGHSIEGFPARDPETFLAFIEALNQQQEAPEQLKAHLAANPAAQRFDELREAPVPSSFASLDYHMLHPYTIVAPDGQQRMGRITITSVDSADHNRSFLGQNCLDENLKNSLSAGPVTLGLTFTPATAHDVVDDLTLAWNHRGHSILLGHLILERLAADQDLQRSLVFNPAVLPPGITFAGDPLVAARLQAYELAAARRLTSLPGDGNSGED